MKSRVVTICLLTVVLSLLLPAVTRAQFIFTTNNNNTITITEYIDDGSAGDVTIPNTTNGLRVTGIGPAAFYQCDSVTGVTIGTNVTTIGTQAFFQCTALASATIPGSVTNIGLGPFWDCQSLTALTLSSSNAFYGVLNNLLFNNTFTSLIQYPNGLGGAYTLPAAITNVGSAFVGNTLTSITANTSNLYFANTNGALFNKNLRTILDYPGAAPGGYTIPTVTTNINSAAFEYCSGMTNVIIGTNVVGIGSFAFYDCAGLMAFSVSPASLYFSSTNGVLFDKKQTTLLQYPSGLAGGYVIPVTVTNVTAGAFGDAFGLTSVFIPDGVTSIGEETFYSCFNLASATIGDSVSSIGVEAFYKCGLTGVSIPNSVTNIGEFAFFNCAPLLSVTFGTGVESIGFEAFDSCYDLTNACFEGNEPVDGGGVFAFDYVGVGNSLPDISYVSGTTGWGALYDGIPTVPCTACAGSEPPLAIAPSGPNVILTWSDAFTGFTLQSATNPVSSAAWSTVSPSPADINGLNTVTNPASGQRKFYRLMQ